MLACRKRALREIEVRVVRRRDDDAFDIAEGEQCVEVRDDLRIGIIGLRAFGLARRDGAHFGAATLHAYQALDFDDLILRPAQLFAQNEAVRDKWQNRLRYLLIDEYQDTNACQYELLKQLADPRAASRPSATTIRPSTAGAARPSKTSRSSARIFRSCTSSSWSRTTARRCAS